jgi:predicted DNA-binding transcriptional regulator AlpA
MSTEFPKKSKPRKLHPNYGRRSQKQASPIIALPSEGDGNLREAQVCGAFAFSKSKLWRDVLLGRFPAPFKIGGITVWDLRTVRDHLAKLRTGAA